MKTRRSLLASGAALLLCALPAYAQQPSFPQGPITIVVPYAPGGSSDNTARLVAKALAERLKQPVLVDNKPGAGGNIGAAQVAKARADGHTLLFAVSSHAANMALYKKPGFDLLKDFAPVSLISTIPNVLVVQGAAPASRLADFIKLAGRANPSLTYGSAGNGTSSHLAAAHFAKMANVTLQHIPFKGGAPANQELLAGRLDAVFAPMVEILPHLESGKLKALGVTSPQRSPRLPQVPAIAEALPGYKSVLWNSLMAPAGTPPEVVAVLGDAVQQILKNPEVRAQLEAQGTVPIGSTPQEFARMLPAEVADWAKAVQITGATLD
jgi:tripartite-type tricarboxylate transporter receptor subunit TctC